jgi:hypothetical protein
VGAASQYVSLAGVRATEPDEQGRAVDVGEDRRVRLQA